MFFKLTKFWECIMKKLLMLTICAALCLTSALQAVKITTSDDQEFEYINEVEIAALRQNKTVDNFLKNLNKN